MNVPSPPPRVAPRERLAWAAAAFFVVTTLTTAMLAARQAREAVRSAVPTRSRIDAPPGTKFGTSGLALSPDGRVLVAALEDGEGRSRIWTRPLDALAWRTLAGTDGARAPFWSPDGREVAFFAGATVRVVPLEGGVGRVLAGSAAGTGGAWSPRGAVVFAAGDGAGLVAVPASGGPAIPLTRPAEGRRFEAPCFLPDGTHFVYLSTGPDGSRLRAGSLDGRDDRDLAASAGPAVYARGYLVHADAGGLLSTPFHEGQRAVAGADRKVAGPVRSDFARFESAFGVSGSGILVYVPADGDGTSAVLVTHWDPDAEPR